MGTIKSIGRIYQQTFLDTYSKLAFVKLYDRKNALVAADLLNDRVLPFLEEQNVPLLRVLTDRGTEYCGNRECHEYQLYLAVENIDHSRTKAKSPQTNGICERFHRTLQEEFYSVAFRKKLYRSLDELQSDLDVWLGEYNEKREHSGKYCYGKTPWQTFLDSKQLAQAKMLDSLTVAVSSDVEGQHGRQGGLWESLPKIYRQSRRGLLTRLTLNLPEHNGWSAFDSACGFCVILLHCQ